MLSAEHHSAEEAEKVLEDLKEKIEDGASFTELVEANSEAPDASDGGLLGEVALSDLNSDIAAAVEDLDEGEISEVVKSDQGYHLFLLEARASAPVPDESESRESEDGEDPNMRREQVRASLKQRKLESKMSEFFTKELYKLHSVDNKLEGNS
jgi:parvulin-like peptidyl-prolyl isomerase